MAGVESGGMERGLGGQEWIHALRRYLVTGAVAHLVWEIAQLPLYTLWRNGSRSEQAFALLHCTGGDVLIAGSALLTALVLVGQPGWPRDGFAMVAGATIVIGLGYTMYSEWFNTTVRVSWTYSELMPLLPYIGTGLAPLAQWIVVPALALRAARGRSAAS